MAAAEKYVTGRTVIRTLKKRGQLYVSVDDLIVHIQGLALDYKKDGQDIAGVAYEVLAEDLYEDTR